MSHSFFFASANVNGTIKIDDCSIIVMIHCVITDFLYSIRVLRYFFGFGTLYTVYIALDVPQDNQTETFEVERKCFTVTVSCFVKSPSFGVPTEEFG